MKGRHVWDLGAGAMGWSHELVRFGASTVTAVDTLYKHRQENYLNNMRDWKKCAPDGVTVDERSFSELVTTGPAHLSVAFISWPDNAYGKTMGLEVLVERADTIVYLGNNFDGTSCGSKIFWQYLMPRKVLCTLPSRTNTLTVYGKRVVNRYFDNARLPEEHAAMSSVIMSTPEWFP